MMDDQRQDQTHPEERILGDRIYTALIQIIQPFVDLARAPRAQWGIYAAYLLEGFVYFGILAYLAMYFAEYVFAAVDKPDVPGHLMVGVLTGGITIAMFFLGPLADRWGPRRATIVALALMLVGRVVLAAAPESGLAASAPAVMDSPSNILAVLFAPVNLMAVGGLLIIVLGYGLYQPAAYLGIRQFTSPKTAAMGFAMLYALMNLGGWLPSFMSPVRQRFEITGAIWVYVGFTALALVLTLAILTRRTEQDAIETARRERANDSAAAGSSSDSLSAPVAAAADQMTFAERVGEWVLSHPLMNGRFAFFIFVFIPVQTLFAYNWLILPQYVERAFRESIIGKRFEIASNLNPLLIFILVPIVTAITQQRRVYNMMIWGTLIMAAPTFLLAIGPYPWTLFGYLFVMTIGEAMWQPRFLQYAAEIAPEGRTGAYMGVAQFPWFLTKMIAPLYTGTMMARYCPPEGDLRTELMWLIFACVAMMSTVMLVLAKNWVGRGFKERAA